MVKVVQIIRTGIFIHKNSLQHNLKSKKCTKFDTFDVKRFFGNNLNILFLDFHIPGRSTRINAGVGKAIASFNILVPAPQREARWWTNCPTCVRGKGALLPAK